MRKLTIISTLILLSVSADKALGCVCMLEPNPTPEKIRAERLKAFDKAANVFSGEIVILDRFTVRFRVDKIWKGPVSEEITMLTGMKDHGDGIFSSSSCDYHFTKGEKYLVYAYGPPEELKTHACSRTTLLKYAEEEMRGLDEITPHRAVGEEHKPDGTDSPNPRGAI
jgi:hypothetical protein